MGMTIPREKSTSTALSMRRHFSDLYDVPEALAKQLGMYGPLAAAIADMAIQKVKLAKVDKQGKALLDKRSSVQEKIDTKVKPVLDAMSIALGGQVEVNDGFRDMIALQTCKSELAEMREIDSQLSTLALGHKKDIIDKALCSIMGAPLSGSGFPLSDTVYIVNNNGNRWVKLAFAFTNGNVPNAVYCQVGDSWDVVDCDLSNEFAYKLFTSPRALLKFSYVYNALPERLPAMLQDVSGDFNPVAAITPKAKAEVEDVSLEQWLDSWGVSPQNVSTFFEAKKSGR